MAQLLDQLNSGYLRNETEETLPAASVPTTPTRSEDRPRNSTNSRQPSGLKEEYIQEVNILLLGETGVGKSTFINAFVNYLTYEELKDAECEELTWLIPAKFSIADDDYENTCTVEIGNSDNECQQAGASATQMCKSYVFHVDDVKVRLIDTPGIGDTRGIEQDDVNFENILRYLGEFEELHAICLLLKPNNARLTILFQYCVKHLLSRLQKSASKNIIFLFTNSRSTFYRPGDTFIPLKKILEDIKMNPPFVEIPCNKNNIFCIDNEGFRFLAALKYNLSFTKEEKGDFEKSWKKSSQECWRLLKYIVGTDFNGLIPHRIQDTVSINEARRLIIRLSQPVAEIAQLIQTNLIVLQRHKDYLEANANNLNELQGKLYIPVINVRAHKMDQPRTTCMSRECCDVYEVGGVKHNHYRTLCHNPCYLRNVPAEIVGSPELIHCTAMGGTQNCQVCGCQYLTHLHIYYITETYEDKIVDVNIDSQISKDKIEVGTVEAKIKEIKDRSKEYKTEEETIIKTIAKFAHFLQNNAITPYNDAYKQYMEYLIDKEKSLGDECNKDMLKRFEQMLLNYHEEKAILDKAFEMAKDGSVEKVRTVTAADVFESVTKLYSLKYTGAKIKELYDKQESARSHELRFEEEYVHRKTSRKNRWLRLIFGFGRNG
ncbi:hypothetical protein ILUMI_08089 [Ignelater luminosus]|uniref:DUF8206 domain-containing protein n=1 Tax=Ignelater luminosus TaxID=2038154 RepID=A0A8K0D2L4_IGNLU|nr:hypothetical protein ILUMI_08089 [Ignelater luminosus]